MLRQGWVLRNPRNVAMEILTRDGGRLTERLRPRLGVRSGFLQAIYGHTSSSEHKPPRVYAFIAPQDVKTSPEAALWRKGEVVSVSAGRGVSPQKVWGMHCAKAEKDQQGSRGGHVTRGCEPPSLLAGHPKSLKWKILARA